jgi:predicted aspartyl protease
MGLVRVKALFGDANRRRVKEVLFLADTGAYFPIIPPSLAKEFRIKILKTGLTLADKREVEAGVSLAYFKLMDREGIFQIAVMDSPEPILGVTVFEGLGIRIDPVTGKLEYSRPYGLSAIYAISGQKLLTTYKSL